MGDYTRDTKEILSKHGCYFKRQGKGDHEIWHSPITNGSVAVDSAINTKVSANKTLKDAGIKERIR